jgi:hypothetical protein
MGFEILGDISNIETIAKGSGVRERRRLRKAYGQGTWRKLKDLASIKLDDAQSAKQSYIGMKHMASGKKNSKSSVSSRKRPTGYVVCLRNDAYAASLEPRKLYPVLPDAAAEKHGLIRVIDESGEDYLYPAELFIAVRLPQSVTRAIAAAS